MAIISRFPSGGKKLNPLPNQATADDIRIEMAAYRSNGTVVVGNRNIPNYVAEYIVAGSKTSSTAISGKKFYTTVLAAFNGATHIQGSANSYGYYKQHPCFICDNKLVGRDSAGAVKEYPWGNANKTEGYLSFFYNTGFPNVISYASFMIMAEENGTPLVF